METIFYFSRNGRKPPFKVTIGVAGKVVYIGCDCDLGVENKICRHKINAIRGDKDARHSSTPDDVISRLRFLFPVASTLRQHLEEKWRSLREFATSYPGCVDDISEKRRILGEAFANGFVNELVSADRDPFDVEEWEGAREVYVAGLSCLATLKYINHESIATTRDVLIEEIFINKGKFYLLGYCSIRKQRRTFRVDRIQGVTLSQDCSQDEKSILLNVIFQGVPARAEF